jgi:hypothetical protein
MSINHGRVYLHTHSITGSKCIYVFPRSQPPGASPNLLNHCIRLHLSVYSISASNCIPHLLNHGQQLHLIFDLISESRCIPELTRSWPPMPCLCSPDLGIQVHLQPHIITTSSKAQSLQADSVVRGWRSLCIQREYVRKSRSGWRSVR